MAKDPEEMHPEHGRPTGLGVEEVCAEEAIEGEHDLRGSERRDDKQNHGAHHQIQPNKERHFEKGHAGTAQAHDGGDKVDGGPDAAEPGDEEGQRPEIGAVADGKGFCGERRISEPANVGRAAGTIETVAADETEVQEQTAESGEPEAPGVEAGEGHVARADHERDEVIAKTEQDGHGDEKDHGGAMHGKHLIEELRRDEMIVRNNELVAHDGGFDAADHEEQDGVENVENSETFMVNGGDPGIQNLAEGTRRLAHSSERN